MRMDSAEASARTTDAVRRACLLAATDPEGRPRTGYPRCSSGFSDRETSSYWIIVGMARELGITSDELRDCQAASSTFRRIELTMLRTAAYAVLDAIVHLPEAQRWVLLCRARGTPWRRIVRQSPGRVYFSLVEDHDRACRRLEEIVMSEIITLEDDRCPNVE